MNRKMFVVIQVVLLALLGSVVGTAAGRLSSPPSYGPQPLGLSASASPLTPVGSGFTYQGRLLDGGGPANGQYDFQIIMYDALVGGNQVGPVVTATNQLVSDGLITLTLDFGAGAYDGNGRWLEVQVRPAGGGSYTILSPRQPLTPAPYAMLANTVADGSITTAKIANDAIEPSRISNWFLEPPYYFDASSSGSTNIIDPGVSVTIPTGKAYYYQVIYKGVFEYIYGDRVGSNTSFYAAWYAAVLANNSEVGQDCSVVQTGYRQDWAATGASGYWTTPFSTSWLVRLGEGTHNLKIQFRGYSDGTMNRGVLQSQRIQIMRLY